MSDNKTHSIVAPSAAHRWTKCPPSAMLSAKCPQRTSAAAEEGTLAHRMGELWLLNHLHYLQNGCDKQEYKDAYDKECINNPLFKPDMPNMVRKYTDYVVGLFNSVDAREIQVELKVPLFYYPQDTGTVDCVIFTDKTLYVIDLKFGRNAVEAKENKQLIAYAMSVISAYPEYDFTDICMIIVQPRVKEVDIWKISAGELYVRADEMELKAKEAINGTGNMVTGTHCKWCPVSARCRVLKEDSTSMLENFGYKDPKLLSATEVSEVLSKAGMITDWISSVNAFAVDKISTGNNIPGYKLVHGQSKRSISDSSGLWAALDKAGYDSTLFKRTTCIPLTQVEKLVGKDDFSIICSPYLTWSEPKSVLVRESDTRQSVGIQDAISSFAEYVR